MNRSLVAGIALGALGVTAGGAVASYNLLKPEPAFAEVLAVTPVTETVRTPREVCRDVTVTHRQPVKDPHQVTGTVIGAVVGGVLGNQVGGGSGKKVATVAGAAAGGYAGNKVQENMQARNTYTTTERRCETVTDTSEHVIGYDVSYQLDGQTGTVRMSDDPGQRIPVRNGRLVLDAAVSVAGRG
ncbi:MAG: glycine zipper 2TM domain-containing protein [Spongiibacteraceae bacterium]|nr:glycine zipper 2TM domain-containing protein [Spongiibacteraceae bacterium]